VYVCLNDDQYNVEYEGFHVLYASCGCYGHVARNYIVLVMEEQLKEVGVVAT